MICKGTPLVLALGMLFTSVGSYAESSLTARVVTLSADGTGASYSAASSDAYSHAYNDCLLAHGSAVSGPSYLTISQPAPGHTGLWVVRASLQCSLP
jgi:hypothetical protein